MKKIFFRVQFFAWAFAILTAYTPNLLAQATEAPEVLIKRISQDVMTSAKSNPAIKSGDRAEIMALVEAKIFPYVDFHRTTQITAGRYWRVATPEQKNKLAEEFRRLLVHTYAGALSNVNNQELRFKPFRGNPSDTDVVVRSEVVQPKGEPIQLDYRLAKTPSGWKIYDMNVYGAWLIATYKSSFESEIKKSGIDGLIRTLAEKNDRLAGSPAAKK